MTGEEIGFAVFLTVAAIAGIWQLSKWAAHGFERVCNGIEERIAASRVLPSPPAPEPGVRIEVRPQQPDVLVTYWNGCAIGIDRGTESGRLALLSGVLLRFHWHARPSA